MSKQYSFGRSAPPSGQFMHYIKFMFLLPTEHAVTNHPKCKASDIFKNSEQNIEKSSLGFQTKEAIQKQTGAKNLPIKTPDSQKFVKVTVKSTNSLQTLDILKSQKPDLLTKVSNLKKVVKVITVPKNVSCIDMVKEEAEEKIQFDNFDENPDDPDDFGLEKAVQDHQAFGKCYIGILFFKCLYTGSSIYLCSSFNAFKVFSTFIKKFLNKLYICREG